MRVLLVATKLEAIREFSSYTNQGALPVCDVTYLIEFHAKAPPGPLPESCIPVKDFADCAATQAAIDRVLAMGPFEAVIAYDEVSMIPAARIRQEGTAPGLNVEQATRFRDKVVMKTLVSENGVHVPRLYTRQELRSGKAGFPLVAKPRSLAGSENVQIIYKHKSLQELLAKVELRTPPATTGLDLQEDDLQFEEYIAGDIYHFDGICLNGSITNLWPSQYIGTCLDYSKGNPMGSLTLLDSRLLEESQRFSEKVITALECPDGVFHLEAIRSNSRGLVFLEIGMRPGGGLLVPTLKKANGIDLQLIHCQVQMGITPTTDAGSGKQAGYLMFPGNCNIDFTRLKSLDSEPLISSEHCFKVNTDNIGSKSARDNLVEVAFYDQCPEVIFSDIERLISASKVPGGSE